MKKPKAGMQFTATLELERPVNDGEAVFDLTVHNERGNVWWAKLSGCDSPWSSVAVYTPGISTWSEDNSVKSGKPTSVPKNCHQCGAEMSWPAISIHQPPIGPVNKPRDFCSLNCFWLWVAKMQDQRAEGQAAGEPTGLD